MKAVVVDRDPAKPYLLIRYLGKRWVGIELSSFFDLKRRAAANAALDPAPASAPTPGRSSRLRRIVSFLSFRHSSRGPS